MGKGRPRNEVRDIPCDSCGEIFGQTQYEISINRKLCPPCVSSLRSTWAVGQRGKKPETPNPLNKIIEIHLRGTKLHQVPKKDKDGDWYVPIKTRRKGSNEKLKSEKMYLGLREGATYEQVEAARKKLYTRLQLDGAIVDLTEKQLARRKPKNKDSMKQCIARKRRLDHLISPVRVTKQMQAVRIPDVTHPDKQIRVGRFRNIIEARKAMEEAIGEQIRRLFPCGCCGLLPVWRRGQLTHVNKDCRNATRFCGKIPKIMQAKLWNLEFAGGSYAGTAHVDPEFLARIGFYTRSHLAHAAPLVHWGILKRFSERREPEIGPDEPAFE